MAQDSEWPVLFDLELGRFQSRALTHDIEAETHGLGQQPVLDRLQRGVLALLFVINVTGFEDNAETGALFKYFAPSR